MRLRDLLFAALIGAVLVAPAMAQEKDAFRVGLAGVFGVKVGDAEDTYGAVDTCYGCKQPAVHQYDPLAFRYGPKSAWQLEFGYTVGDDAFKMTYWYYKNDVDQSRELQFAPITDPGTGEIISLGQPLFDFTSGDAVSRIDASSSLKTHVFDLLWEHTFAKSEKAKWAFVLGLREWQLKTTVSTVDYDWDGTAFSAVTANQGWASSDSKGIGAVAGLTMTYTFGPRVWLDAAVRTAYLQGKSDASLRQQSNGYQPTPVLDEGGNVIGTDYQPFSVQNVYPISSQDRGYTQFELDARLTVNIVQNLDLFAGYQQRVFNRAAVLAADRTGGSGVTDLAGASNTGAVPPTFGRIAAIENAPAVDRSFRGYLAGLAYRF